MDKRVEEILRKYGRDFKTSRKRFEENGNFSQSYLKFKEEISPPFSKYEKWCHSIGNFLKINLAEKDRIKIQKFLNIAHLDIQPSQVMSLAIVGFLGIFLFGLFTSLSIALISNDFFEGFPLLFFFLTIIIAIFIFYYLKSIPERMATKWRLKTSSQMVPAILYVVIYMRHTSNLEKAIAFASENLDEPLALDFKKVFYDAEIGRFSTIKESLDNYLETWRDYSPEFIEAFHLIEGSLFEPSNERRIATLEKSLLVVLDGVYDRMLKFSHDVRSPLTNIYMLGVVLPTLGLALIPLASAMLQGMLKTTHVFLLFNLIVPFLVFYLTDNVLRKRPGGYGETNLLERNPLYYKFEDKKIYLKNFLIFLPLLLIGMIPLFIAYTPITELTGYHDYSFSELGLSFLGDAYFFDFKENVDGGDVITTLDELRNAKEGPGIVGPFGFGALVLSLFIPLSIALFFSISYLQRTKELIVERDRTKGLEEEFNNSLFQLGNRIGNGVPPELVFGKVAQSSRGLRTADFFNKVNYNIQQMGMSLEKAIFDEKRGAINSFPSSLISTSMKILIESSKKGLRITARSLMSISEYVKNIKKINQRLKDMLAKIISDMKSNMTFLAPLLAGVVVGLALMITSILDKLIVPSYGGSEATISGIGDFANILSVNSMLPPYYLQISVGIYLIQIIFILTSSLVVIDSGNDPLTKVNLISKNLKKGALFYLVVSFVSSFALFLLASIVLP